MKAVRLILATLYLGMMVLLPAFHIAFEVGDSEQPVCCGSHGHQEHEPQDDSSGGHEHSPESCGTCQLMLVQFDSPEIFTTPCISTLIEPVPSVADNVISYQPILYAQARAPPFKTA